MKGLLKQNIQYTRWEKAIHKILVFFFKEEIEDLIADARGDGFADGYQAGFKESQDKIKQSQIDLSQINGRIDVILTLQTPLAAATTLIFSARAAANEAIDILGLSDTDFRVVGTTGNITALVYDSDTRLYTMTLSAGVAAAEDIYVQLYDAAFTPDPVPAIQLAGEIYAGTSNTVTVL